jgi:ribonuclease P protein component
MFVAGRKMGDAVMRNRCKRVLREACRRAGGPWPGLDVALIARPGVATAPFKDVDSALASCLRRAGMATQ